MSRIKLSKGETPDRFASIFSSPNLTNQYIFLIVECTKFTHKMSTKKILSPRGLQKALTTSITRTMIPSTKNTARCTDALFQGEALIPQGFQNVFCADVISCILSSSSEEEHKR